MSTRVVAIDGPGGSGKSTFADLLADRLDASIVHTDDFASWDVPLDWYPRLRDEVLVPLSENRSARFRPFDWELGALRDVPIVVEPAEFVIVEGVSSSREAFRPYLSFSVWVETPREVRLRRGLDRDGEEAADFWASWMAEEDVYVRREDPAGKADMVVDGTR
ncbi:uridine kinase family protein [Salininema proteolyticum]|uniref:Uridine kinase n=1 Tax=Salininema proteolyticum TaxID=1607685 RepID=A0ABV8U546_9ACTN